MFRLVLALVFLSTVAGQCNRQSDQYIGDLCYTVSNMKLKFSDAENACNQNGENLAVIHNTMQSNFLTYMVRADNSSTIGEFWIGLSRSSLNSRFQWDDGTTMSWSNFDSNIPKSQLFVAESTSNGKWQTLDGQQALYFACSYRPGNVNPSPTPSGNNTDNGFTYPVSYPVGNGTDFPVSWPSFNGTDSPVSWPAWNSTDYPFSNSTGYPVSYPAANGTDYPWSGNSTDFPFFGNSTGYPVSYPSGNSTDFPWPSGNSTGYPVSYPAGNGTEVPVSYPAGNGSDYPASVQPTGYPVSVPPGGRAARF
ncbi:hypothetical protein B9Z55_017911 [Caenorhabditis nigoni]|uniref:C-type lectin domain-containing protein n=1 Tax=Caenorhabditis nigoni TaxID=1611254 RepID=A0A2G5TBQ1_9PELO|nr:hypothetical protein B9Z55_017911 [Caenorhabditis nigoni]